MDFSQEWPRLGHLAANLNQASQQIALQQLHPARQAFANQSLLETVLGNLSTIKLLQLRSLNQAWNAGACKILSKRNTFKLNICFRDYSASARQADPDATAFFSSRAKIKLKFLMEAIAKSAEIDSLFPHCEFRIHNLFMRSSVADIFFPTCGHVIQNFSPMFPHRLANEGSEILDRLIDMLFNKLPNLHQLRIDIDYRFLKDKNPEYFEQFFLTVGSDQVQVPRVLPKLKLIKFDSGIRTPVLKFILQAAINLEEIHITSLCENVDASTATIDEIVAQGKTHLLSFLKVFLSKKLLELTEFLVKKGFAWIKKLNMHLSEYGMSEDEKVRARNMANKIITSNAHMLQSLKLLPFYLFESFRFPAMPKLRRLEFNFYCYLCQPIFLDDFKFSLLFPRLKALKIETFLCEGMRSGMFGESLLGASYTDQVFPLKSIEFLNQPVEISTISLPQMFPNLVCVNMGELWNVPQAFSAFWRLPHLKILTFEVVRQDGNDVEISENLAYQLESALTGFSTGTCFKLASERDVVDMETVETLRVNRSMLDAKNLRELNITVHYCYGEETTTGHTPVLSRVSGLFAFRMCPQVEVLIKLHALSENNAAALEADIHSVLDYVTSVEETRHFITADGSSFFRCQSCQH